MIIVSHDREFLNQVCNKIVEVEVGKTISYKGNYSKYLELRQQRLTQWRDKYDKQQKYIREEEKWIKTAKSHPAQQSSVKQRESALLKLQTSDELIALPPKPRRFRFRFLQSPQRSNAIVIDADRLSHGYGDGVYATLFEDVSFRIMRGQRVGFGGPNGSGKSTMLRLIMGLEDPKQGFIEQGGSNVHPV